MNLSFTSKQHLRFSRLHIKIFCFMHIKPCNNKIENVHVHQLKTSTSISLRKFIITYEKNLNYKFKFISHIFFAPFESEKNWYKLLWYEAKKCARKLKKTVKNAINSQRKFLFISDFFLFCEKCENVLTTSLKHSTWKLERH